MRFSADQLTALLTLSVVGAFNLWLQQRSGADAVVWIGTLLIFVAFSLCFLIATAGTPALSVVAALMLGQYLLVLLLFWLSSYTFNAILLVIWSAGLPYVLPFRIALWTSPLWSLPPWLLAYWLEQEKGLWVTGLLFWTFNLFALVMMQSRREAEQQGLLAEQQRQLAEQANGALRANEALVQQAARQQERMRIARDIHDLIGHHLTALIINLQVAGRRSEGEAGAAVARCEAIARLLMADVREAVSDIREHGQLDLQAAAIALVQTMPGLQLDYKVEPGVQIRSVKLAAVLLRCLQECITNAVRHGGARHISIALSRAGDELAVTVTDDGKGCQQLQEGNGLKGMRERLRDIGGSLDWQPRGTGFALTLSVPYGD